MKHILSSLSSVFFFVAVGATATDLLDAHIYTPGQYEAHLRQWPDQITAQVSLDWLNAEFQRDLAKAGETGDATFQVITAGFSNFSSGESQLILNVEVDGKYHPASINFRCRLEARLAVPAAPILDAKSQNLGISSVCNSADALSQFFQLNGFMSAALTKALDSSLDKTLFQKPQDLKDWMTQDQRWGNLISKANVQLRYCSSSRWPRGLCINLGFPSLTISNFLINIPSAAPAPMGPMTWTRDHLLVEAQKFVGAAPLRPDPIPFPAKRHGMDWDDDDSTVFNGLLCSAGITEGCAGVQYAQGKDGAFWRSPYQVDKGTNPFTGDQLTGVLNYIVTLAQEDPPRAKIVLEQYLKFIAAHRVALPTGAMVPVDHGYKDCGIEDKTDNCVVGAGAWLVINELATRLGLSNLVPPDVRDVSTTFGYDQNAITWESLVAPPGYRMHLVGIYVYLLKRMGINKPILADAAAILALRMPHNPFFLYLHLGPDERVLKELTPRCKIDDSQTDFGEWAWERADSVDAWKTSMRWDCAFMFKLLAGPPYLSAGTRSAYRQ